jgi:hypothetical protein
VSFTTPAITVTITSPAQGNTIYGPDIMVRGTITNPTGNETGVTVNGIVATVYGNQFVANHIKLTEGENVITVTAKDTTGKYATISITVNAITTGNYIGLTSNIESGISPLEAILKIDGTFGITSSTITATGPTQPEILESTADEYRVRMTTEGIYYITANATGPDNIAYQDTIGIVVLNRTQMDNLLKGKWEGMKNKLQIGEIENALILFDEFTKQDYRELFNALSSMLPTIVQEMADIQFIKYTRNTAIYDVRTIRDGIGYSFQLLFTKDSNGIWRITSF